MHHNYIFQIKIFPPEIKTCDCLLPALILKVFISWGLVFQFNFYLNYFRVLFRGNMIFTETILHFFV